MFRSHHFSSHPLVSILSPLGFTLTTPPPACLLPLHGTHSNPANTSASFCHPLLRVLPWLLSTQSKAELGEGTPGPHDLASVISLTVLLHLTRTQLTAPPWPLAAPTPGPLHLLLPCLKHFHRHPHTPPHCPLQVLSNATFLVTATSTHSPCPLFCFIVCLSPV